MRLIDADALLAEYDRVHEGPPGKARTLIEKAPTIEPERPNGKWIPCDKGIFPKNGKEALVTDGENMMVAYYRNDAEAWDNYDFGWVEGRNEEMPYGINKVIAWMPLPKPYKVESKEV